MSSINKGLKPGALLRDNYRIEQILGQGGFGITYLATDLSLDRYVAIKEFFPKDYCERETTTSHITIGTSSNIEFVLWLKDKFLKEARNLAKLDHPGIIKIYSAFEDNNTAYYVMDYIEGKNLSEIVKQTGALSESKALQYISQVGNALDYVHKQNINHLDIKPANIMIRNVDDRAVLIDFGLSKQYDSEGNQTSATPAGISHGYAPLEQYNAGGVSEFSPQTDIYSLAATLYYLLSGSVPPHATDLIDEDITFPPYFPIDIRPAIIKAMASSRKNRPATVNRFINSLKAKPKRENKAAREEVEEVEVIAATPVPPPLIHRVNPQVEPQAEPSEEPQVEPQAAPQVGPPEVPSTPVEPPVTPPVIPDASEEYPVTPEEYPEETPETPADPPVDPNVQVGNKSNVSKIFLAVGIGVLAAILLLFVLIPSSNDKDSEALGTEQEAEDNYIVDAIIQTTLGNATYTGTVDENGLPHGKGVATWEKGDGIKYDGEWVHGNMEGKTIYTQRSGDTFEGTFKDNHYHEGRYTIKEDGSYFEGTFKDEQPDNGSWYDKTGKKL